MTETKPKCDPSGFYTVKRVCAVLEISAKTLNKYRALGYLRPVNPNNPNRPKFSGQAILDCWTIISAL